LGIFGPEALALNREGTRALVAYEGRLELLDLSAEPRDPGPRPRSRAWTGSAEHSRGDTHAVACSLTPDGRFAVTADWDNSITRWDANNGRILFPRRSIGLVANFTEVAISPDGARCAVNHPSDVIILDFRDGAMAPPLLPPDYSPPPTEEIFGGTPVWQSNGQLVLVGHARTKVLDAATSMRETLDQGLLASQPDGELLPAVRRLRRKFELKKLERLNDLFVAAAEDGSAAVAFVYSHADPFAIRARHGDQALLRLDSDDRVTAMLAVPTLGCLAVSEGAGRIIGGSWDGAMYLYELVVLEQGGADSKN
jgi:hypothetical protein